MLLNRSSLYGTYKQRNHSYCNVLSQIFFVEKKFRPPLSVPTQNARQSPNGIFQGYTVNQDDTREFKL